jgi:hypothetical protein
MRHALPLLALLACEPPLDAADGQAPPPSVGGITLTVPPLYIGESVDVTVDNAYPGESVYLLASPNGLGAGPCLAFLGGACLGVANPVKLLATTNADSAGVGTFSFVVPGPPGTSYGVQAVVIHGLNGEDTVLSFAQDVTMVERDDDGDGVPNAQDPCPDDALDDSDGDGSCDSDDPCPDDPTDTCNLVSGKRVFATANRYDGAFGGVFGADAVCQSDAAAAGLSGTYRAWISDASSGPANRFVRSNSEPYVLVDGTVVANNWADLTDGTIQAPIDLDEYGNAVTYSFTYSFTRTDGTPGLFGNAAEDCYGEDCHCRGWTTTATQGNPIPGSVVSRVGFTDDDWTDYSFLNACGGSYGLYCFEQ